MEQWKRINDYYSYEISTEGRIRRNYYHITKYLQPAVSNGYHIVRLSRNGEVRSFLFHTLVLETFKERVPGKNWANHLNGDRLDDRVCNLEWATRREVNACRKEQGFFTSRNTSGYYMYLRLDKDKKVCEVYSAPRKVLTSTGITYYTLSRLTKNGKPDHNGYTWIKVKKDIDDRI